MILQKRDLGPGLIYLGGDNPDLRGLSFCHGLLVSFFKLVVLGCCPEILELQVPVIENAQGISLFHHVAGAEIGFPDVPLEGSRDHSLDGALDGGTCRYPVISLCK